jgi:hypothetical protein
MHRNRRKALDLIERLEKADAAPVSVSSAGYVNPIFGDFATKKRKRRNKKGRKCAKGVLNGKNV